MVKTSGNASRFLNTQHKLRYVYQFLTGKAQRTMRIYLRWTADPANGEETYEIAFNTFATFLTALDRHFGDQDENTGRLIRLIRFASRTRSSPLIMPTSKSSWTSLKPRTILLGAMR